LRAVAFDDLPLNRSGAAYGIDDAREFDKKPISRSVDEPPAVFCDSGLDHLALNRLDSRERALLVHAHKPAEADYISGKDDSNLGSDALVSHSSIKQSPHFVQSPGPTEALHKCRAHQKSGVGMSPQRT